MTEKRVLAIIGFLLALIGGILILAGAANIARNANVDLEFLVEVILGIAAILGGLFIYKGRMSTGGLLTIVIGVVALFLISFGLAEVLIIIGGILGIVGAEARAT